MDIPLPGVKGDACSHLDQAWDQPFDRLYYTLATNVELTAVNWWYEVPPQVAVSKPVGREVGRISGRCKRYFGRF
jgi:hypothetical protein